jgi:phosphodiester glycosidase
VKPTTRRSASLAATLACLLALAATAPAGARDESEKHRPLRPIVKTRKIAPGLLFTRIIEKRVPRRTFILKADLSRPLTVDMTLAGPAMPSARTTSDMGKAHDALAAINGDFSIPGVRPVHPLAQDGDLLQSAGPSALFAVRQDETGAYIGTPDLEIDVTDLDSGQTWDLDRWNRGSPNKGEIAGFSPVGGTLEFPPPFACSVRLLPDGPRSFDSSGTSVIADFRVDTAACSSGSMPREGGVVLSTPPATDEATQLLALTPGTPMRLRWSLGWEDVFDAIGGMPVLVQDGRIVVEPCPSRFCRQNPRTAIGWTASGRFLMVVIDGRQPRWSSGPSIGELARIMKDLGAVDALNLDGGGASAMWVDGELVNRPSDGQQRVVTTSVLLLPGPDPGEA